MNTVLPHVRSMVLAHHAWDPAANTAKPANAVYPENHRLSAKHTYGIRANPAPTNNSLLLNSVYESQACCKECRVFLISLSFYYCRK